MDLAISSDRPLALIAGASSGIGYELAKIFAKHGFDLVITSKNPAIVETAQICRNLGANVESVIIDLANDEMAMHLSTNGRPIEAMAINTDESAEGLSDTSSLHLVKLVLKAMLNQKKGRILITSDLELSACESLKSELESTAVTITSFVNSGIGNASLIASQSFDAMMLENDLEMAGSFINKIEAEESIADALSKLAEPVRLKH